MLGMIYCPDFRSTHRGTLVCTNHYTGSYMSRSCRHSTKNTPGRVTGKLHTLNWQAQDSISTGTAVSIDNRSSTALPGKLCTALRYFGRFDKETSIVSTYWYSNCHSIRPGIGWCIGVEHCPRILTRTIDMLSD